MKKQLSVLLAAVLACTLLFSGLAFASMVETNIRLSDVDDALSADAVQAQIAYEQILESINLEAMLDAMNANYEGVRAMNSTQLQGLYNHVQGLYELIENPDEKITAFYQEMLETVMFIAEGNGVMLLAVNDGIAEAGSYTASSFLSQEKSGKIQLAGDVYITDTSIVVQENKELEIDLNGWMIKGTGTCSVIVNKGKLTISDSNPNSTHRGNLESRSFTYVDGEITVDKTVSDAIWVYNENGSKEVKGGIITGGLNKETTSTNKATQRQYGGGGIENEGNLILNGGTIIGCEVEGTGYGGGIHTTGDVTINGGNVCYNWNPSHVGGIYVYTENASLTMTNGNVDYNSCAGTGGGVRLDVGATFNMSGGSVSHNRAMGHVKQNGNGGGVYSESECKFNFDAGKINYNYAYNRGGGIDIWDSGTLKLSGSCEVIGNKAGYRGGGISIAVYTKGENNLGVEITNSGVKISNNQAPFGGGISIINGNFEMTEGTVMGNVATMNVDVPYKNLDLKDSDVAKGGALYIENGTVTLSGGTFSKNTSAHSGGGVYVQGGVLNVNGSTVSQNEATMYGGAAYVADLIAGEGSGSSKYIADAYVTLSSGSVNGNEANIGGAIYVKNREDTIFVGYSKEKLSEIEWCDTAKVTVNGTVIIENNIAEENGGAIAITKEDSTTNSSAIVNFDIESGSIKNNTAGANGGAVYVAGGNFSMSGGSIVENTAEQNGGAAYVSGGSFTLSGGSISSNHAVNGAGAYVTKAGDATSNFTMSGSSAMSGNIATGNGGAAYVSGGAFTLENGTMSDNDAVNGGAAYVTGGNFTMKNGSVTGNEASTNGGAVYLTGGNFKMEHGAMDSNTAENGGAVYMAGTQATTFTMESGEMNSNTARDDGGAIYATSGTLYIGLDGCAGSVTDAEGKITNENALAHTTVHKCNVDDCTHPLIQGNTAGDCGGAIAIGKSGSDELTGVVHFYCGNANENTALHKGVGKNVFMEGGEFHIYDGTNVGIPRDPDLVIIGGEIINNRSTAGTDIYLHYYQRNTNTNDLEHFIGLVDGNTFFNLPDGEYFWPNAGEVFIGWTAKGSSSGSSTMYVRDESEYLDSGEPIYAYDNEKYTYNGKEYAQIAWDENQDNIMHLYALWAPAESTITYVENVNFTTKTQDPQKYQLKKGEADAEYSLNINPVSVPGYKVKGWYLYQNEGMNANWGREFNPDYKDGQDKTYANLDFEQMKLDDQYTQLTNLDDVMELVVGRVRFGDITLIADMEEQNVTITYQVEILDNKVITGVDVFGNNKITIPENITNVRHDQEIGQATGEPKSGTPVTNAPFYKFKGWYTKNAENTLVPVAATLATVTTDNVLTPVKQITETTGEDGLYFAETFYAVFELNVADLTITKSGMTNGLTAIIKVEAYTAESPNEVETFKVSVPNDGAVTLSNLIIGTEYNVEEQSEWTWRYGGVDYVDSENGIVSANGNTVEVKNKDRYNKWLDDESSETNAFTGTLNVPEIPEGGEQP